MIQIKTQMIMFKENRCRMVRLFDKEPIVQLLVFSLGLSRALPAVGLIEPQRRLPTIN